MDRKCVVLGVTGGIAAYKSLDIVSTLVKNNIEVRVIMTKNAMKFVNPLSFQALSKNPVITDMFDEPKAWEIQHISLAKKADLMLIAPATANIIGKVLSGISDDMLSTTIMATKAPVVFAPAMNTNMYDNKIVQNNILRLKEYGYKFIEPDDGRLACGDVGKGKLASVDVICEYILSMIYDKKDMIGKRVVVTAGPTISNIDPVRYITNNSSGKMGYAIASEARDRGADVTLISGPTSLKPPTNIKVIDVKTNNEMMNAVLSEYDKCDIVIKAAAVADYKAKNYSFEKIKKSDESLYLEFERDNDILSLLGSKKCNQILVGFAAESSNLLRNATNKLEKKNLDYIVANDIKGFDSGFKSDFNKVSIISKDHSVIELEKMTKRQVAEKLFDIINERR